MISETPKKRRFSMERMKKTGLEKFFVLVLAGLTLFLWTAQADCAYPDRQVEMIVAFGPGGAADVAARLVSSYMSKKWDQPINVINMPGASGIIGTRHVLNSKPDGYTLMMDNHAVSAMLAATQMELPFKWDNRTVISRVTVDPVIFSVKSDSPWKSLKEVADHIGKNPKVLRWGVAGVTAVGAFAMPEFLDVSNLPTDSLNRVVFKSGGEVVTNLAGGHIDLAAQQYSESAGLLTAGKVRGLCVVHTERLPGLNDIPTAKEVGYPGLTVYGWQGLSGPAGLPKEVVDKWSKAIQEASKDPAFLEQAAKIYKIVAYMNPEQFREFMQAEYKRYLPMAERLGMRKK
ncbi:MAG: tripartite tricarboxylate transporter substrate binding protein [Desulfobacteraceae bacterium]|nr:MAG: tripartite tricarboxylate transporter substrate binding protein [Desulfobacteraceae bacterium]